MRWVSEGGINCEESGEVSSGKRRSFLRRRVTREVMLVPVRDTRRRLPCESEKLY